MSRRPSLPEVNLFPRFAAAHPTDLLSDHTPFGNGSCHDGSHGIVLV